MGESARLTVPLGGPLCRYPERTPKERAAKESQKEQAGKPSAPDTLAVLPLRDIVVFPHMIVPLFVGREKSVRALEAVMKDDKQILLVAQKNAAQDDPSTDDIYRVGTVSTILQLLKLPDGTVKVLVEGGRRAKVTSFKETEAYFEAFVTDLPEDQGEAKELEALSRTVVGQFEQYIKLNKKIAPEVLVSLKPDRGAIQAGGHDCQPFEPENQRKAGAAGDAEGWRAAGTRVRAHGVRNRRAAGGKAHTQRA